MNKERTLCLLDEIQHHLETDITYAAITEVEDVFHEEDNRIVRAFTFSRGTRETVAVIGEDGYLYYYAHIKKKSQKGLKCVQAANQEPSEKTPIEKNRGLSPKLSRCRTSK